MIHLKLDCKDELTLLVLLARVYGRYRFPCLFPISISCIWFPHIRASWEIHSIHCGIIFRLSLIHLSFCPSQSSGSGADYKLESHSYPHSSKISGLIRCLNSSSCAKPQDDTKSKEKPGLGWVQCLHVSGFNQRHLASGKHTTKTFHIYFDTRWEHRREEDIHMQNFHRQTYFDGYLLRCVKW